MGFKGTDGGGENHKNRDILVKENPLVGTRGSVMTNTTGETRRLNGRFFDIIRQLAFLPFLVVERSLDLLVKDSRCVDVDDMDLAHSGQYVLVKCMGGMSYRRLASRSTVVLDVVGSDRRTTGIELVSDSAGSLSPFGSVRGGHLTKLIGIVLVIDPDAGALGDSSVVAGDEGGHGEGLSLVG